MGWVGTTRTTEAVTSTKTLTNTDWALQVCYKNPQLQIAIGTEQLSGGANGTSVVSPPFRKDVWPETEAGCFLAWFAKALEPAAVLGGPEALR